MDDNRSSSIFLINGIFRKTSYAVSKVCSSALTDFGFEFRIFFKPRPIGNPAFSSILWQIIPWIDQSPKNQ